MNDNHDKNCFHCAVIAMIHERYPAGVDMHVAGRLLGALAAVAGDMLAHASDPDQSIEAFTEIVYRIAIQNPRQVNVVIEARH